MRREDRFRISRKPYAVDLSTLQVHEHRATINAVWFRRRNRVTVACLGVLVDYQGPAPKDAAEFLIRHADGRHGGDCQGRWDGTGYWGAEAPEAMAEHLTLLKPMLASYPDIPAGYDGWWTFQ